MLSASPLRAAAGWLGPAVAAVGALALVADAGSAQPLRPRAPVVKPSRTVVDAERFRTDVISVRFRGGTGVRAENGRLSDGGSGALAPARDALRRLSGGRWQRTHTVPEAQVDALRERAEQRLRRRLPDLNLQLHYFLPPGMPAATAIDALNALEVVEIALPVPRPAPPPAPPDYESYQGYLEPGTDGISADCAWQLPGGTGSHSAIADLEYSWNLGHVDLPTVSLLGPTPNDPFSNDDHGTAVLGMLFSQPNGFGTTGAAWESPAYVVATNTGGGSGVWDVGAAVMRAADTLGPGDVILVEQQISGVTSGKYVPVEWWLPWYDAIVTAVGNGIIVVEAAGNGAQDLDDPAYSTGHGGHWPFLPENDSGAFIVGAGGSPSGASPGDRSRMFFSTYGSTLDLQGWGHLVTTTGYGSLYGAEGSNASYTSTFSGTSSAAPMVAAAAAIFQSVHFAVTGAYLPPEQVKSILRATGAPQLAGQFPTSQPIGPRPDVEAALAQALPGLDLDGNGSLDACEPALVPQVHSLTGGGVVALVGLLLGSAVWMGSASRRGREPARPPPGDRGEA